MPIDLATLDTKPAANAGRAIELRHPATRAPLGIFVDVVGVDSDLYRRAIRERQLRRSEDEVSELTPERMEEENLDLLATCTTGWRGMVLDGQAVEFSPVNARMIYERFPWIRDQVDRGIGDRSVFLPA